MIDERRRFPRFQIDQLIQLSYERESFVAAKGVNISEGGILCITDAPVDIYSRVFLMLTLVFKERSEEKANEITCEGIVNRCDPEGDIYYVGIQFTDLQENEKRILKKYIDFLEGSV
ncbi:MAG: PilZ domain-containing protein [Spirochaetota bacterium]